MALRLPDSWSNWNLEMLVFEERGKPEYPEKNLSEQGREPTSNSTHIWSRHRDLNPGHIGGRRVLSPLRHPCSPIDLFSLYILFSQYRSCDNTPENCFFQISSYSRAFVRIIYEKTKGQVPLEPLLGKQNMRVKQVYFVRPDINEKPTFSKLTLSWSGSS